MCIYIYIYIYIYTHRYIIPASAPGLQPSGALREVRHAQAVDRHCLRRHAHPHVQLQHPGEGARDGGPRQTPRSPLPNRSTWFIV